MKILLVTVLSFLCLNIFSKDYEYEVIAEDLSSPWGIAMIDDNNILFTELSGQLRRIKDGVLQKNNISGVPDVLFAGQGGLSGIILDPNFQDRLGMTALMHSIEKANVNAVNILTKQEINEDITDFSGKTIYDYSKMSRNLLIKKIIETSNFNN